MVGGEEREISDLIVAYDTASLARRPVRRSDVVDQFRAEGHARAAEIVARLPAPGGVLDEVAIDALLVRVHTELQRLHEEFQHGLRVQRWLLPLLAALRETTDISPIRVVDVGCGLGFVTRWLAAHGDLGNDVELLGVDYNAGLIGAAAQLADHEALRCRFRVGNAFALDAPAAVFISTGVLHHFRRDDLQRFFMQQRSAHAFAHWDIAQTWAAELGAWIFHRARMREEVSRHDGVVSARRAHPDDALLAAARSTPSFRTAVFDGPNPVLPIFKVLRPIVGWRAPIEPALFARLGSRRVRRLKGLS
ncbi:MAG: class I SAM-dependent methyltransferase [Myxococcota bacterium]